MIEVPEELQRRRRWGADWGQWLDALPSRAQDLCQEWDLRLDGPARHGYCSLVLPVRTKVGAEAMLKLGFDGDDEATLEHLALTHWGRTGAAVVDLLRADPHRRALLLERLGDEDLSQMWDVQACELIGSRYSSLHVPAPPQFTLLSDRLRTWEPGLRALLRGAPVPRRMVEHAVALLTAFSTDEETDGRLVHFDLHYANVLLARKATGASDADWVVIDPKPVSGDPHAEVAPLLVNRFEELAGDVRGGLRRRFEAVVDAALLDEDRARDWVILRMLLNISWALEGLGPQGLSAADSEQITRWLTVAKAVM